MKKTVFIFFLFSVNTFVYPQQYFNFRFDFGQSGWWDGATNVFQLPDGYIIGGGNAYYSPSRLGFYKIDIEGNRIFSKVYSDTVDEYYLGNPGSIVRLNDSVIVASGSRNSPDTNWLHQEGLIYFLNNNFDTLYTKYFGEKISPVDTSYIFRQIKSNRETLVVTGGKNPKGLPTRALLIKTDQAGNEFWEKVYWDGMYDEGLSVICTNDGGYAIGGYTFDFLPPPNLTGDPIVIKTDSVGNQQWFKNYGTPYIDSHGMICSTQDGNMVLGFGYCDSMSGGGPSTEGNPFRKITFIKIDNSGNTIWNKKYGKSEGELELVNIRENSDGTIISTGITTKFFPTAYKYVGWILKTTSDGDSLWYRQYDICKGESTWNWLYDVIETSDKGYIACGVVYPQEPDTGSQDGWVLKVDSIGCENPEDCWVGMKDEAPLPANDEIEIYPNPVAEDISVKLRITGNEMRISIRLYDMFGRMVKMVELSPGQTEFRMDVSQLPHGMYYVVVSQGDKIHTCRKLIKQRM